MSHSKWPIFGDLGKVSGKRRKKANGGPGPDFFRTRAGYTGFIASLLVAKSLSGPYPKTLLFGD